MHFNGEKKGILTTFIPIMGHPIGETDHSSIHSSIRFPKQNTNDTKPTRFALRHSILFGEPKWIVQVLHWWLWAAWMNVNPNTNRVDTLVRFPQFICFRSLVRGTTVRFAWKKFKQIQTKQPQNSHCVVVWVCVRTKVLFTWKGKESAGCFLNSYFFVLILFHSAVVNRFLRSN